MSEPEPLEVDYTAEQLDKALMRIDRIEELLAEVVAALNGLGMRIDFDAR